MYYPFSMLDWPRLDAALIFWCLVAIIAATALVTLARLSLHLFAAAAERAIE